MASDLFAFDSSFFSEPFSPFTDSVIDILQSIPDENHSLYQQKPVEETNSFDQIAPAHPSSSPPSHQLENLSLSQTAHFQNASFSETQFPNLSALEVKTEFFQSPYNNDNYYQCFGAQSYGGTKNAVKFMQRSYSSNCFEGKRETGFLFQPRFDCLTESPNFQTQVMSSPENSFPSGQMRRVCSTGDLQNMKTTQRNQKLSTSPLATERSFMEESNFKVGRYSAEERKERIHRYRAKRAQRNFNKTIKYACRKTLADNRPRIRGRFVRSDENGDTPKASGFIRYEDDNDIWIDGFNEDYEEGTVGGVPYFKRYGQAHIQYYGYS